MSVFLWYHRGQKFEGIVSKKCYVEKLPHFHSPLERKSHLWQPHWVAQKRLFLWDQPEAMKAVCSFERMSSNEALLERMCSPSINKQEPFHVLRAQKDLQRLKKSERANGVESVGHFFIHNVPRSLPSSCPVSARRCKEYWNVHIPHGCIWTPSLTLCTSPFYN